MNDKERLSDLLFKYGIVGGIPGITGLATWLTDRGVAVPVRCKDCKHWGGVTLGNVCRRWSGLDQKNCTKPTDFCSFGERREQT